jgi:hypothetical protein
VTAPSRSLVLAAWERLRDLADGMRDCSEVARPGFKTAYARQRQVLIDLLGGNVARLKLLLSHGPPRNEHEEVRALESLLDDPTQHSDWGSW